MKFTMLVYREEEVEIPDLPEDVMAVVKEFGAQVSIWYDLEEYSDSCGQYAEIQVEIQRDEDESQEAFRDALENCTTLCDRMNGDIPWFQSDGHDGYEACKQWTEEMKKRFPGEVIL